MSRYWLTKIILPLLVLVALGSGCGQSESTNSDKTAKAALWKDADGSYTEEKSSQYTNGKLQLKLMENNCVLYNFDVMKGSEKDDLADEFDAAGTFLIEDNGVGTSSLMMDKKEVKLTFKRDGKKVIVTQEGELVLPVKGTYVFAEKALQVSENAAVEILENLAPVTTSLNDSNRPYNLEYSDEPENDKFVVVRAINTKSNTMFARFLVANDLSSVYRQDEENEPPTLIFGKEANMKTISSTEETKQEEK